VRRLLAALLCACAAAAAAGCGGSSDDAASTGTTATAPAPAPTAPAGDLVALLPPQDAVSGLRPGAALALPTARAFVDALYQRGDPTREAAERRLERGGYAGGALRDQAGEDPEEGVALVRSYVITMGGEAAARQEVDDAVAAVVDSSLGEDARVEEAEVEVPDVDGARGLRVDVTQGDVSASVIFVTFPAGAEVYGIQAAARAGADLPEDEVVAAAQDLAARAGAAP
jgi:hypothetical protein